MTTEADDVIGPCLDCGESKQSYYPLGMADARSEFRPYYICHDCHQARSETTFSVECRYCGAKAPEKDGGYCDISDRGGIGMGHEFVRIWGGSR